MIFIMRYSDVNTAPQIKKGNRLGLPFEIVAHISGNSEPCPPAKISLNQAKKAREKNAAKAEESRVVKN